MLKELLAVFSTSAISEDTGDSGLLLSEASELLSSSWRVVKVILCVTCGGDSEEVSLNSCVIFGIGPIDKYVDWSATFGTLPELLIIPERIKPQDEDEFGEAIITGVDGEGTGLGKGIFFFDASSSPFKTFCTLTTTSLTPGTADESSPISVASASSMTLSVTVEDAASASSAESGGRF
jgi:hypothetical protein